MSKSSYFARWSAGFDYVHACAAHGYHHLSAALAQGHKGAYYIALE